MRIPYLALAAVAVPALLFAACGGDDDPADSGNDTTPTSGATATLPAEGSSTAGASPATGGSDSPSGSATPASGGGQLTGDGADDLRRLAADVADKTYQVSYDLEIEDAEGNTSGGKMTLANKPPANGYRFEMDGAELLVIDDGTDSYFCTSASGTGQCLKSASGPDGAGDLVQNPFSLDDILDELNEDVQVDDKFDENVGGIDSECFTVTATDGESIACFSKADGIVTKIEGVYDGTTVRISATSLEDSVDDALLAPPAGYEIIATGG